MNLVFKQSNKSNTTTQILSQSVSCYASVYQRGLLVL
jgi:hypothetical protein